MQKKSMVSARCITKVLMFDIETCLCYKIANASGALEAGQHFYLFGKVGNINHV